MEATPRTAPPELHTADAAGLFRAVFEQTVIGLAHIDMATGRFLHVNQRYADIVGYSREELEQSDVQTLTLPDDRAATMDGVRRLTAGEISEFTGEQQHRCKDGRLVWVRLTVAPLFVPGAPSTSGLAVLEDVTERRRAAASLGRMADELAALNAFGRAVNAPLALDHTTKAALSGMLHVVRPDLVFLFLREGDRLILQEVVPTDARQRLGGIPEHRVGECICGLAVREKTPLFSRDIFRDHRCSWEECKKAGLRSFAALPLISGGDVFGVIGLASAAERDFEGQAEFLDTLAGQVSVALHNARLYDAAQRELAHRQRAEAALQESERRYRTLADSGQALIWTSGLDKKCDYFNQPWLTFTGRRLEQELGDGWTEGVHPDDLTRCVGTYTEAFDRREAFSMDYRMRRHDGEIRWIQDDGTPRYDSEGRFLGYIGHCLDVTERRRVEQALADSEAKASQSARLLEGLFDAIPDVIGVQDSEHRILRYNAAGYRLLGLAPEQTHGRTCHELIGREHPCDACATAESLRTRQPAQIERHDAALGVWLEVRSYPVLDERGDVAYIIEHLRDITDRKDAEAGRERLQAQFMQAQKMESVGRLAGGVAHDFNNMLQAILGNASLALETLPSGSSLREHLEEIQKSAERSADLTRQLLAFARKQTIAPKVLDLNETVAGMLKMLRRLIGEDVDMAWRPGPDLWKIKMDPSQIDQILANLCVNARDAIAGTGSVTLETANATLDDRSALSHPTCAAGDYVMLAVSDTGRGLSDEARAHLFEPFFTTKEHGKGTGLGLATVFGIVEQNHGLIDVGSAPGHGTTFTIYLPRAEAASAAAEQPAVCGPWRGTETVLLVEDEQQILDLGRRVLEQHGYTVLAASSPHAAMAMAAQARGAIQLLITDVVLPGMNGKALMERLRTGHPGLRCLFISGYTADVIARHGVLEDGVQFLQKPFSIQALAQRVREMLDEPTR